MTQDAPEQRTPVLEDTGVVVIARNEGQRLVRCLESVMGRTALIVYADSDSSDGSAERARSMGAEVVALDRSRPLNAARGRNAGLARLRELRPDLRYVFFLDGDCRLVDGFLAEARAALVHEPALGALCGRRRELRPAASLYNRVVDLEWNTPAGESAAFGGDVLVRIRALEQVGGYDETMNQGEDPELCFRLRQRGWRVRRLERDMTLHDVALERFGAWWKRHARGGHAYLQGAVRHWGQGGRFNVRPCLSILAWGLVLPCCALLAAPGTRGLSLALLAAHGFLWMRVRASRIRLGDAPAHAGLYASFLVLGKLAEALGLLRCACLLLRGRESALIEYKDYQRRRAA